jgi:hypothetical protein
MNSGGVGVRWGAAWLKLTRSGLSPFPHNVRLQNEINLIMSLSDNSMIDWICLHSVYKIKKTKTRMKTCARRPAWILDFTGGASLIRTGDLRIMIPSL